MKKAAGFFEERGEIIERIKDTLFSERKGMEDVQKIVPSLDPVPHSLL
jgi:hypothetical protein